MKFIATIHDRADDRPHPRTSDLTDEMLPDPARRWDGHELT